MPLAMRCPFRRRMLLPWRSTFAFASWKSGILFSSLLRVILLPFILFWLCCLLPAAAATAVPRKRLTPTRAPPRHHLEIPAQFFVLRSWTCPLRSGGSWMTVATFSSGESPHPPPACSNEGCASLSLLSLSLCVCVCVVCACVSDCLMCAYVCFVCVLFELRMCVRL